jgi:hypothetical protein
MRSHFRLPRARSVAPFALPVALGLALFCVRAHAQPTAQTEQEQEQDLRKFERRRENITLNGHTFVAPLSLRSVPFEFAIPVAQLASRTQVGVAWVDGERNVDQGPTLAKYALLTQRYDLSMRLGDRVEIAATPLGEVASGLDGASILTGGAAAAGGSDFALAYRLVPFDRIAVTLRATGHFEWGYRANVEPLVYQAATNPLSLVNAGLNAAQIGSPTRELGAALGLGLAYAISARTSLQLSGRGEAISTRTKPWLMRSGTEDASARELFNEAWNWSVAASFGIYWGSVLLQPQFGYSWHGDQLTSPVQDLGPFAHTHYYVPALQVMYIASPILQLGGGVGLEIASSKLQDRYANQFSTSTLQPFVQLVARYIWGETWPGH